MDSHQGLWAQRVVNDDVEQAEAPVRALSSGHDVPARGLLVTPYHECDETAAARLDPVRLIERNILVAEVERILALWREYRRGWTADAAVRAERRAAVSDQVPLPDWLHRASELSERWVDADTI